MTTTQKENTSAGTEALSGQRSEPCTGECNTPTHDPQLPTLQHRIGPIRLKARMPGACIALEIPGPPSAALLTIEEAQRLAIALVELIEDIEADARARDWSRQKIAAIIAAADGSAESYASKL